jgi:2-polyprenyl-3-methyl-5-hydroxy-6-metoxy-1,4-benzoquinol methylase
MDRPDVDSLCRFCAAKAVYAMRIRKWPGAPVFKCHNCCVEYLGQRVNTASNSSKESLYDEFAAGQRGNRNWTTYVAMAKQRLLWQTPLAFPRSDLAGMRFLDIGCGSGHLMQAAKELGMGCVAGVETDGHAVAFAQSKGLDVYHGVWPIADLVGTRYDFISLMHSLEHMPNPGEVLESCLDHLNEGGTLAIDVPDQASLPASFKRLLRYAGRRPDHYGYLQPPWHICAFRLRSFEVFAREHRIAFLWKRRTSPLDKSVFPHTDDYWSGRFKWNKRVYTLARMLGQGGYLTVGLRHIPPAEQ